MVSVENLLEAWREFIKGKRSREDALAFERDLMRNLLALHTDLSRGAYRHTGTRRLPFMVPRRAKSTKLPCVIEWCIERSIVYSPTSIDLCILFHLLTNHVADRRVVELVGRVLRSFSPDTGVGLPLGSLTSQLPTCTWIGLTSL